MTFSRQQRAAGAAIFLAVACSSNAPEQAKETTFSVPEALSLHDPSARQAFRPHDGAGFAATAKGFELRRANDRVRGAGLSAVLPLASDAATTLQHQGIAVTLRSKGSLPAAGSVDRGRVVYANAFAGADRYITSSDTALEEWMLLRSRSALRTFEWELTSTDLGPASSDGAGGISFAGRDGRVALHVPRPFALDAAGHRFDASLAWDERAHTLSVALEDASRAVYPLLLDPSFEVSVWQKMGTPAAADSPVMAFDAARGHSVLITGGGTFTSNGLAWARASDAGPPSRVLGAAAYDPVRQRVVYFGGKTAAAQADTWEWDGATWSSLFPTTSPAARYGHAMAFDPVRNRVVLFGGVSAAGAALGDMWEWDGSTWAPITPAALPSARGAHAMVLDSARNKVVLFGGGTLTGNAVASANAETWEWDGAAWTQSAPASSPSARGLAAATFNSKKNRVVLFGGEGAGAVRNDEQWEWDGVTWVKASLAVTHPGARSGAAFAFDSFKKQGVLFGGAGSANETWFVDDVTWTSRAKVEAPALLLPSMVYDAARQKVVMFGGSTPTFANNFIGNLYEWDGGGWTSAGSGPAVTLCGTGYFFNGFTGQWQCSDAFPATVVTNHIFAPAVAYDATRSVVVAFGGTGWEGTETLALIGGGPPFTREVSTNETWTYNGAWTKKSPAHSPPVRREAAMVNAGTKLVLFGGYGRSDTWTWDGTDWTEVTPGASPSARGAAGMAYDPERAKVVLFGGATNSVASAYSAALADTWEYDLVANTWTNKTPAVSPDADAFPSVQYDPLHKRIVMFAALKGATSGSLHQWAWDGTNWTDITSGSAPPVRRFARVVFDEARKEFVMHGGGDIANAANATGETWTYYTRGGDCTTSADCAAGLYCTDGVCCEAASCGTCQACNVAGLVGTCAKVFDANDSDTCTGTKTCDTKGSCKVAPGQACTATSECAEGFCVDGVCCDTECKGTCQACRADLKASGDSGVCGMAKAGTDSRDDCAAEDPSTCGLDGACDGAGACKKIAAGVSCASSGKTSACVGNRATGFICDGKGSCQSNTSGTECGDYVCDAVTGGCPNTCTSDAQCTAPLSCDVATGKCAVKEGAHCKDESTLVNESGVTIDCAPYRCASAKCGTACASLSDCAGGLACSTAGTCEEPAADAGVAPPEEDQESSDGGCGCKTTPTPSTNGMGVGLGVALAFALRSRRRLRRE